MSAAPHAASPPTNYLAGYPPELVARVRQGLADGSLAATLRRAYPRAHGIRTDRALYEYVQALKEAHMRTAGPLSKVAFDGSLRTLRNALGTHTTVARVQGGKLKAKREIRIATLFREAPEEFLRMIVVHELAHMKEAAHDKAFYQLCRHMAADYHRLEFDLRAYLTLLDATGEPLWGTTGSPAGGAGRF